MVAPNTEWRDAFRGMWPSRGVAWALLLLACVGSRLATTITYVEDPDSLRFALSVADEYDVATLQPHFPGYPVFWFVTKLFTVVTGRFSISFSLVGGLATAGVTWGLLHLRRVPLRSADGVALAALVFFNPLLWLMGNRYMPDLLGTAWGIGTLAVLLHALRSSKESRALFTGAIGMLLIGLLAGLRLSYLPFVALPAFLLLWCTAGRTQLVLAGLAGVMVWLVPMTLDTGLKPLVDVARIQTTGHFTDFGGTVHTESNFGRRLAGLVQGIWADGLGAWWAGRHPLTILVGIMAFGTGSMGAWRLWNNGSRITRRAWLLGASVLLYGLWIFFFQNVVHKSRHVLPLLALILLLPAAGGVTLWRRGALWGRATVLGALAAYAAVTFVLVGQHLEPTAIAQAKTFIEAQSDENQPVRVASVPLVNNYLRAQRVDARYLSIEDSTDVQTLQQVETGRTLIVGTYASLLDRAPTRTHRFYHNPHVNRMWPEVTVYVYDQ